ncbi:helix-turn-helix domain-containing protein [Phenylobacterium sp. J426]|uniref:helix-turn-helix domain-containing protein n=1 Tax=Phenylobacterium sp. J426 TaxID=2898439 RepID=UPI0021513B84|nr:helix-turn-helix domain-containing protein [Phenylobacterium sp. J426]MCR5875349.1 helix-turn-helix domain-containing protein [Phenylobacterium sp. J426]
MTESEILLTALVSGGACGALAAVSLVVWRGGAPANVRYATLAFGLSAIAWVITESAELCRALGPAHLLLLPLAYPVGGLFWLFVLTLFDDRKIGPPGLLPAALLVVTGPWMRLAQPPLFDWLWYGRNAFGALLAAHALFVVVRGWRDDLVEGRRRFRAMVLAAACFYTVILVAAGFLYRADPSGPWLAIAPGRAGGGAIVAALAIWMALLTLQTRPSMFGASRRSDTGGEGRAEVLERQLLSRLTALMAGEGWRREGLTIGDLARELGAPEHRLRRLINQRLGHRNFADFVNSHRIDAAKRRLADPEEARTTVAAIAFDLGYGSLGPFNRAFRAATGATPTEWRRQALNDGSPKPNETA